MLPLTAFPTETARALTGVCFDVDDTVTSQGTLDPDAYRSLFALRDSGLKLLAVTGRPLGFAEVIARTWPVTAAVGENGAGYLARQGARVDHGFWDTLEVRVQQQERLRELRALVSRRLPEVQVSSDNWARRCDLAFDIGEEAKLPRERIDALVELLQREGARTSVSSIHAHAQLGTHDKAQGVARAAEQLWSLSAERVQNEFLFVGDSGNDAAAFAWFAWTVGVANVAEHLDRLPVAPRYVTTRRYGSGFAELAALLVSARASHG